jgi:leucyl-tRNA synthetase
MIDFVSSNNVKFTVFTTRPDTIFGVTYLAISPENALLSKLTTPENRAKVTEYVNQAKTKAELQRNIDDQKTGVFTGTYAINPITNKKIPLYVSDYVLNTYATGIVMGVPAHDERDFMFAKKYKLPIVYVISCKDHDAPYTGDGKHINSDFLNDLNTKQATAKMVKYLLQKNLGKKHVNYKIHE